MGEYIDATICFEEMLWTAADILKYVFLRIDSRRHKVSNLVKYYEQLEMKIPIYKRNDVDVNSKKVAIKLLAYWKKYKKAEKFLNDNVELAEERFNFYLKQLGDLAGKVD